MKVGKSQKNSRIRQHFGSIRQELMLFAALLCVVLIALVWLLNVQLLEPLYNRKIKADLRAMAQASVAIIEKYDTIFSEDGNYVADFYTDEYTALLVGKCLEIADSTGRPILKTHNLSSDCLLHPSKVDFYSARLEINWNSRYIQGLRALVRGAEEQAFKVSANGHTQMVVACAVGEGYTVIVSTDLERIGQATAVLGTQMPIIALVMLFIGILGAFLFSRWFSKPLTEISCAAREMAKGNYKVRVTPRSTDEIGTLAHDFNTMADEVSRTSELQRDLIANISHDLRTPLTLIKGYAETVRDLTGNNVKKRNDHLNVIVEETDRLSALVNSVMELSKYASGTEKLNLMHFDLAQFCDEVAYRYGDAFTKGGYTLEVRADACCMVEADPDMLGRVIHNFLSNAMHHVGEDGWVALRVLPLESGVTRVEIEDHGTGITPEDLPYIFDKYYRSRTDAGKVGTGLGLSISKAILVNHGFAFGVLSKVGSGSTFWFEAK